MSKLSELPKLNVPRTAFVKIEGTTLARRTRERNFCIRRLRGVIAECRVFGLSPTDAAKRIEEIQYEQRLDKKLTDIYREWLATEGFNFGVCDWGTFYYNAITALRKEDANG